MGKGVLQMRTEAVLTLTSKVFIQRHFHKKVAALEMAVCKQEINKKKWKVFS